MDKISSGDLYSFGADALGPPDVDGAGLGVYGAGNVCSSGGGGGGAGAGACGGADGLDADEGAWPWPNSSGFGHPLF